MSKQVENHLHPQQFLPFSDCYHYSNKFISIFFKLILCQNRLKITSILSNFFRSVIVLSPDDLLPCVYLCLNKVEDMDNSSSNVM